MSTAKRGVHIERAPDVKTAGFRPSLVGSLQAAA